MPKGKCVFGITLSATVLLLMGEWVGSVNLEATFVPSSIVQGLKMDFTEFCTGCKYLEFS